MSACFLCAVFFFVGSLLVLVVQPLSLGAVILLMVVGGSCLVGVSYSAWYGYILFMVYVGGLLVMFAYVAALAPNVLFIADGAGWPWLLSVLILADKIILGGYFLDPPISVEESELFLRVQGVELGSNPSLMVGLAVVLLLVLLAVVKICYHRGAALRRFG